MDFNAFAIEKIEEIRKAFDLKKSRLGQAAGYTGVSSSQGASYSKLQTLYAPLTIQSLNGIASFLKKPVGYFLPLENCKTIEYINEEGILLKIQILLKAEQKNTRKERKTKRAFGEKIGYASDISSQFNTAQRILNGSSKLKINHLPIIADFFEKPIEWFLKDS